MFFKSIPYRYRDFHFHTETVTAFILNGKPIPYRKILRNFRGNTENQKKKIFERFSVPNPKVIFLLWDLRVKRVFSIKKNLNLGINKFANKQQRWWSWNFQKNNPLTLKQPWTFSKLMITIIWCTWEATLRLPQLRLILRVVEQHHGLTVRHGIAFANAHPFDDAHEARADFNALAVDDVTARRQYRVGISLRFKHDSIGRSRLVGVRDAHERAGRVTLIITKKRQPGRSRERRRDEQYDGAERGVWAALQPGFDVKFLQFVWIHRRNLCRYLAVGKSGKYE